MKNRHCERCLIDEPDAKGCSNIGCLCHADPKFKIGDRVKKVRGYRFPSVIQAVFTNFAGEVRYVAELDGMGLLHIFNEEQLRLNDQI